MRWQLAREWAWRDRNSNIWRWLNGQSPWPWGAGGCKEGDCTGRDWRGSAWYAPFDWRQRNRVPENFLQWSYLHDVPRTIFLPPGFQGGRGAHPGGWNQLWRYNFPGSGTKERPDGNRDQDDRSSLGSDRRKPSFPSPTWLADGSSFDDLWTFSGDNNDTDTSFTGPGTFWSNPNSNFWEQLFRQDGPLPSWLTSGRTDTSNDQRKTQLPWFLNWDPSLPSRPSHPSRPSRPENIRPSNNRPVNTDDQKGGNSPFNRIDKKYRPETTTVAPVASRPTGQGGATSAGSNVPSSLLPSSRVGMGHQNVGARFRRQAALEEEFNETSESLAPPPSLAGSNETSANDTNLSFAREDNSTINGTELEENGTRSDENKDLSEEKDEIARALARNTTPSLQSHWWDSVTWTGTGDTAPGYGEWSGASNDRQDSTTEYNAWNSNRGWDNSWVNSYYGDNLAGSTWPTQSYWSNTYPGYTNGGGPGYNSWPVWRNYENYSPQWLNGYTGYNYQLNPYRHNPRWGNLWNTQGNEGLVYPSIYSFYSHYGQPAPGSYGRHLGFWKRNADSSTLSKQTSRMMGDFSTYWPWWEWWNFYNNAYNTYQPWSPNWNFYNSNKWFPWYSGRQWNYNWMSNLPGSPYLFSRTNENHDKSSDVKLEVKRSVNNENDLKSMDENVSRWTTGYQPQWWNQYNGMDTRRSGDEISSVANIWNWNWNWFFNQNMLRSYSPMFLRSVPYIQGTQQPLMPTEQPRIYRRSTESRPTEEVSRSVSGPGRWWTGWNNYWPYWWNSNMWRSDRPQWWNTNPWNIYLNDWNGRIWNSNQGFFPYDTFSFSRNENGRSPDGSHTAVRRSTGETNGGSHTEDEQNGKVSRMLGRFWPQRDWNGYNYWPQQFSSGYNYWPQRWGGYPWSRYWPGWNSWNNNNWMWNTNEASTPLFPVYGSQGQPHLDNSQSQEQIVKRSAAGKPDPASAEQEKDVSRMMASQGAFWPQKNMDWPQNWGGYSWNNNWPASPHYFPQGHETSGGSQGCAHDIFKRGATDSREENTNKEGREAARMTEFDNILMPQELRPRWNLDSWVWNGRSPFFPYNYYNYLRNMGIRPSPSHPLFRRQAEENPEKESLDAGKKTSKMMNEYDWNWPQGWNSYNWPQGWNSYNWPQWWKWNMWNNFWNTRNQNSRTWNGGRELYPYSFFPEARGLYKRSTEDQQAEKSSDNVSRMMGMYEGVFPQQYLNPYSSWNQWWNRDIWNTYWPKWSFRWTPWASASFGSPMFPRGEDFHSRFRRSEDQTQEGSSKDGEKKVSNMMGGFGGFWPQYWSGYSNWPQWWRGYYNWNNYWPGGNSYDWTWNRNQPFYPYNPHYYSQDGYRPAGYPDLTHDIFKRSSDKNAQHVSQGKDENVSRMMGGYNGFWPQFWNSYTHWPRWWTGNNYWPWWNTWNSYNWMWNKDNSYSFHERFSRGADNQPDDGKREDKTVSRMMGAPGLFWPQQFWSRHRTWPQWWNFRWSNNYDWMRNYDQGYNPYNDFPSLPYGPQAGPSSGGDHSIFRRSTVQSLPFNSKSENVSRMAGGYWPYYNWNRYNYLPHWWNQNSWRNMLPGWSYLNWLWSMNYDFYPQSYFPSSTFGTSPSSTPDDEVHMVLRRSLDKKQEQKPQDDKRTSRMAGQYGYYWPQLYWNNFNFQPQWWRESPWNRYWPGWNNYNWMDSRSIGETDYTPYQFAKSGVSNTGHEIFRRSSESETKASKNSQENTASRMMGGYNGYWPQQHSFASRYWPLLDNAYESGRFSPVWRNSWMWNTNPGYFLPNPSYYSRESHPPGDNFESPHELFRRSADDNQDQTKKDADSDVSRMTGRYTEFWPSQSWNRDNYPYLWWNRNSFWPGWSNSWMWNYYQQPYDAFAFAKSQPAAASSFATSHTITRRESSDKQENNNTSRMMGGFAWFRPYNYWNIYNSWLQWWNRNFWNIYRYQLDSWNENNWMWNRNPDVFFNYPSSYYYYSLRGLPPDSNHHSMFRRSAETNNGNNLLSERLTTSNMLGGYMPLQDWNSYRFWQQWWRGYQWNWNTYGPDWNNWNNFERFWRFNQGYNPENPHSFSRTDSALGNSPEAGHTASKRSSDEEQNTNAKGKEQQTSKWISGYNGDWPPAYWSTNPYWSSSWGSYPYSSQPWERNWWDSYGNGQKFNPVWSSSPFYSPYYRFSFSRDNERSASSSEKGHSAFRRSLDKSEKEASQDQKTSRMMGWYGWNWPQRDWNNNYWWPWWHDRNAWNGYNWMWSKNRDLFPYSPFLYSQREAQPAASDYTDHAMFKRSTDSTNANGFSQDGVVTAKMMNGGSGYWPQQWWNYPNSWPWWWMSNAWNNYWPGWNNYARMWSTYNSWYPLHSYQFSQNNGQSGHEADDKHQISKRSPSEDNLDEKKESLGRWTNADNFWTVPQNNNPYLPWQETDMWNSHSRSPYWNTFNQAWNNRNIFNDQGRYPYGQYFYSKGANRDSSDKESMLAKRDAAQGNQDQSSTVSGPNLMDLLKKNNFWQLPHTRDTDKPQQPPVSKRSAEGSQKNEKEEDMGRQMTGDRRDSGQFGRSWSQTDTSGHFRPGLRAGYFMPNMWTADTADNSNHFWNRDPLWSGLTENNAQRGSFSMDNDWNLYHRPNYWAGYSNGGPFRNEFGHPYFAANSQMWPENMDFSYQKGADGSSEQEADVQSRDSEDLDRTKRSADDKDAGEHIARQGSYERYRSFPFWWNGYMFRRPHLWSAPGPWNSLYYMWRNWPRNQMWNDQTPDSYWMGNNLWTNNNDQFWNSDWNTLNAYGMTDPQFRYQQNPPSGVEAEDSSSAATKQKRSTDEDQASVSKEDEVGKQLGGHSPFPSYLPWSRSWRSFYWPRWFGNRYFRNRWSSYPAWYNYDRWNNWNWQLRPTWNIQTPSPESFWNIDMSRPTWDGLKGQIPEYFTTPVPSMSTTAETRQKQNPTTPSRTPKVEHKPEPEHRTTLSKRSTLSDQDRDMSRWMNNPSDADFRNHYSQWSQWINKQNYYDPRMFPIFFMQNGQMDPTRDNRVWDPYFRGSSAPNFFQFSKKESTDIQNSQEFEREVKRRSVEELQQTTEDPDSKIKDPGVSRWLSNIFRTRGFFRPEWQTTTFRRPWQYTPYSFVNKNINYFPWWVYRNWYSPAWYNQRLWSNSWMWSPPWWQYDDAWQDFQRSGPGSAMDASQLWNSPGENEGFFPGNYWPNIDSTWGDLSTFGPSAGADDEVQFTGAPEIRQQNDGDNGGSGHASSDDGGSGNLKEGPADSTKHSVTKRSFGIRNRRGSLRASRWLDQRLRVLSRGATAQQPRWRRSRGSLRQKKSPLDLQRLGWTGNFGQDHKPYWLSSSWEISGNNQPWSKWMRWNKWNGGFVWNDHFDTFGGFNPFQSFSRTGSSSELKDDNIQKRSAESPASSEETETNKKVKSWAARWMSDYNSNLPMGMNFNLQSYPPWQPIMGFNERNLLKSGPVWYNFLDSLRNFRPFHASFPAAQTAYDNPIFPRLKRAAVPPDQDIVAVEPESTSEQMFSKWMNEYSQMPSNWHLWMKNRWPMLNYDFQPGWTNSYPSVPSWGNIGWDKSSLNGNPGWNYQPWNSKDLHENYWGKWNNPDILYSSQSSEGKVDEQEGDKDRLDRSSAQATPTENGGAPSNPEDAKREVETRPVNSEEVRARRSVVNLASVLSKGVIRHKNTLSSNTVSSRKDSGPRKFKRFSAEATARLQNRLRKRLAPTEASRPDTERTTRSSSEPGNVKSDARKGTSTPALGLAEGRASEMLPGQTANALGRPTGQEPLAENDFYNRNPSPDWVPRRPPNGESDLTKGGERAEGTVPPTRLDSDDNDAALSEYNYYDQDGQKWLNLFNPDTHNSSTSGSQSSNTSQWNDWMQLWAYGPNFWDSLDSWDGYPFGMESNAGGMNFNPWSSPRMRYGEFGSNLPNIGLTGCSGRRNYVGPLNYDFSWRNMAHDYVSSVSNLYRDLWRDNCDSVYDPGMSLNPGVNQILYASFGPAQTWWDLLTGPTSHGEGLNPWYEARGYKSHSPLLQDGCCDSWFQGTKYGHGLPVGVLPTWPESGLKSRLQDAFEWRFPWQRNQLSERNPFENTQLPVRQPQESSSGVRVFSGPWNDNTRIKNWQLLNNFWTSRPGQIRNPNWNSPAFNPAANPWAIDGGRYLQQEAPASPWNRDSELSDQPNRWNQQGWQSPGNQGEDSSWNCFSKLKGGATFSKGTTSSSIVQPTDTSGFEDPDFGPSSPLASAPSVFEESSTGGPSLISSVENVQFFPRPGSGSLLDAMTTRASARLDSPISTPALSQGTMAHYINIDSQPLKQSQQPTNKDC